MKKLKFKKGFLYVFTANFLNLLIGIITGFILPKLLSIESYSDIKLFQLYITYVGILHLGFSDGMYLKYGGKEIEASQNENILSEFKTFKIFQIIVTISAVIVTLFLKKYVLFFCALSILPVNIGNYLRQLYQAVGKFDKYAKFTNINTFLIFFMNIVLLFIIKTDNSKLYMIAYVIAYFAYWVFLEIEIRRTLKHKKNKAKISYLISDIKDGFLLMMGNFCSVVFTSIDRLFVQYLLGTIKFAYYSFAVSIENLMTVFINPIAVVLYNYFCINQEKEKIIFAKKLILIFSAFVIIPIFPAKFIVQHWISKYEEAILILILLFAAQYFSIMVKCVYTNLYKAQRKQNRYFIIMVIIIVLSIILNILAFIINKSAQAFAIATILTNLIWFVVCEVDFKQIHFKLKEYIYMFGIIISFLVCTIFLNSIVGMLLYLISFIIMTYILMNREFRFGIDELKKIVVKIRGGEK